MGRGTTTSWWRKNLLKNGYCHAVPMAIKGSSPSLRPLGPRLHMRRPGSAHKDSAARAELDMFPLSLLANTDLKGLALLPGRLRERASLFSRSQKLPGGKGELSTCSEVLAVWKYLTCRQKKPSFFASLRRLFTMSRHKSRLLYSEASCE